MRIAILSVLLVIVASSHGANLYCGYETLCEDAETETLDWPEPPAEGISLRLLAGVKLTVPDGYKEIYHTHDGVLMLIHPEENDTRKVFSLQTHIIKDGEKNGLIGSWDTLYRTERDGIVVYFYDSPKESRGHRALVHTNPESRDRPTTETEMILIEAIDFSRSEFLGIIGSLSLPDND